MKRCEEFVFDARKSKSGVAVPFIFFDIMIFASAPKGTLFSPFGRVGPVFDISKEFGPSHCILTGYALLNNALNVTTSNKKLIHFTKHLCNDKLLHYLPARDLTLLVDFKRLL